MLVQVSSGQGPAECELAVGKLYHSLKNEYGEFELLKARASRFGDGYTSILFSTEKDLSELEGRCSGFARARSARTISVKTGLWMSV